MGTPAAASQDVVLYATAKGPASGPGSEKSSLYTIDPATAVATLVGKIEDAAAGILFESVTGLAFLRDGTLVGSAAGDDLFVDQAAILIEIDPATGAADLIGEIDNDVTGVCSRMPDLAYDPTSDTLFAYSDDCAVVGGIEGLFTVDPATGAGIAIGASGFTGDGNGLAMEPATGLLFATPDDDESLVTIDPATGLGTEVAGSALNVPKEVMALDFHPLTGVLYGSLQQDDDAGAKDSFLVTIDPSNGATTIVGPVVDDTGKPVDDLDAIAFHGPAGCASAPLNACGATTVAGAAKLKLDARKRKLAWKWKRGAATDAADFGAPDVDTDYRMCVYDAHGGLPVLEMGAAVPAGGSWKATKKGFAYTNKTGLPHGISKVALKAGADGSASVKVKASGVSLPSMPLDQSDRVVVQLGNDIGECWDADYSSPPRRNDATQFKAKGD